MRTVWFRFYEELNDFLPASNRKLELPCTVAGSPSVKDTIESMGVPHTEVDMIMINGISVSFSHKLHDGDRVAVYPEFESLDISNVTHLRKKPLRDPKFILDVHLGKLARFMRLLGVDTYYDRTYKDEVIIEKSLSENRTILTHDRGILKNSKVTHGYWIRSMNPVVQVTEIIDRFDLRNSLNPFTRCLECNDSVTEVRKDEIIESLPLRARKYYKDFRRCPGCRRIYWKGSHYENMKLFVEQILKRENKS